MLLSLLYFAVRRLLRLLTSVTIAPMLLATSRSWSCVISSMCFREVVACDLGVGIGSCLRRQAGSCRANGGGHCLCRRIPCCAGTVSW